jgi:hypothetical protein
MPFAVNLMIVFWQMEIDASSNRAKTLMVFTGKKRLQAYEKFNSKLALLEFDSLLIAI